MYEKYPRKKHFFFLENNKLMIYLMNISKGEINYYINKTN